jgi:hypothetical protein
VFREKRKRGGREKGVVESFDSAEYDVIRTKYTVALKNLQESGTAIPDPENPLGFSAINTYCSTGKYRWLSVEQVSVECSRNCTQLEYSPDCVLFFF